MRTWWSLGLILAVATLWRGIGLLQGVPDFYGHVDEVGVAASIWNFFRNLTLRPTEFTYPSLYSYVVAIGIYVSGWLTAPDLSTAGYFERLVLLSYTDPAFSAIVGRLISLFADLVSIVLIHRLTARTGAPRWAWFAALGYAVSVISVRQAHMALPDATAAMLATAAVWRAWCLLEGEGRWRDYVLAGGLCGLVLATKYNGALCALAVVAAHLMRHHPGPGWRRWIDLRLWAAGAAAVAVAIVACPHFILSWESYFGLAAYQVSSLDFAMRETHAWWWIPRAFVVEEYALGGMMLAGVVYAIGRRDAFDVMLLAVVAPAFLYIGSWTRESLHYLLPYFPVLIVQAARLMQTMVRRMGAGPSPVVPVIAAGLLLAPGAVASLSHSMRLHKTDTRTLAAAWIEKNVPDGSTIGMTWLPYCPRLQSTQAQQSILAAYRTQPEISRHLETLWADRPAYRVVNLEIWLKRPVVPASLQPHVDLTDAETVRVFRRGWRSVRQLRRAGVRFLVLPEAAYARYMHDNLQPTSVAARYRLQVNRAYFQMLLDPRVCETIVTISGEAGTRGGDITILRLRDGSISR